MSSFLGLLDVLVVVRHFRLVCRRGALLRVTVNRGAPRIAPKRGRNPPTLLDKPIVVADITVICCGNLSLVTTHTQCLDNKNAPRHLWLILPVISNRLHDYSANTYHGANPSHRVLEKLQLSQARRVRLLIGPPALRDLRLSSRRYSSRSSSIGEFRAPCGTCIRAGYSAVVVVDWYFARDNQSPFPSPPHRHVWGPH